MQLLQKVTCPNIIKHPPTSCHTSCHTHTLCIIVYRSAHVVAHHPERTSVGIWMSSGAQKPPGHIDMTRPTRLGKDRCEIIGPKLKSSKCQLVQSPSPGHTAFFACFPKQTTSEKQFCGRCLKLEENKIRQAASIYSHHTKRQIYLLAIPPTYFYA